MSGQRIRVVRADDLLVCELELDGLEVTGSDPNRKLDIAPGATEARLIHLPPQHRRWAGSRRLHRFSRTPETRGMKPARARSAPGDASRSEREPLPHAAGRGSFFRDAG